MLLSQIFFDLNYYQIHKSCPLAVLGEAKGVLAPGFAFLVGRKGPTSKNKKMRIEKEIFVF